MQALTRDAATFVANLRFEDIPHSALRTVGAGFCDCVGVMLAASNEKAVNILTELEQLDQSRSGGRVLLSPYTARPRDVALINGTAAHALDFDDIGLGSHPAHPSAVLVPTILAIADQLGLSGKQMIVAYVAGYEVWGEIALRDQDQYHTKGWHPTGVFGAIAAASASASMLGLDTSQTMAALSIAASRSSGLISNYGSMTKPMHAGLAAHTGIFAAELASKGFTGGGEAIEHPQGLLRAVSPRGKIDLNTKSQLGEQWNIVNLPLGFKQYPVCYAMHRAVDAAIEVHRTIGDRLFSIQRVSVSIGEDQAKLLHIHQPSDALQGKFSLEFGVAGALVAGRLGLSQVKDNFVRDPHVRALMSKIEIQIDSARDPIYKVFSPCDSVRIEFGDGSIIQRDVSVAKGHPLAPLAEESFRKKFHDCTFKWLEEQDIALCFDSLFHLEQLPNSQELPYSTWYPLNSRI